MKPRPLGLLLIAWFLGFLIALILGLLGVVVVNLFSPGVTPYFLLLPALLATAVLWLSFTLGGLLRFRPAARTSLQILGALSLVFALISGVVALGLLIVGKFPGNTPAEMLSYRIGTLVPSAFFLALGLWWLLACSRPNFAALFEPAWLRPATSLAQHREPENLPGASPSSGLPSVFPQARVAFSLYPTGPYAHRGPGRFDHVPGSIQLIASLLLVGAASGVIAAFLPIPVFLLGFIVNGWSAHIVWACLFLLSGLAGWGLLRLDNRARLLAIVSLLFGCLNIPISLTGRSITNLNRYVDQLLSAWSLPGQGVPHIVYTRAMLLPSILLGLPLYLAAFYFLHKHRAAFGMPKAAAVENLSRGKS